MHIHPSSIAGFIYPVVQIPILWFTSRPTIALPLP